MAFFCASGDKAIQGKTETLSSTEKIKISLRALHEQQPDRTPVSSPVIVQGRADGDIVYAVAIEVANTGDCAAELVAVREIAIEVIPTGYN